MQGVCLTADLMCCIMQACVNTICLLCRLQQVRSLWSEIPHIQKAVEKLSKECMDLLNRIFVVDDKKRITIEAIKEHPWSASTPLHAASFTLILSQLSVLLLICLRLTSCNLTLLRLSSFHLALRTVLTGLDRVMQLQLLLQLLLQLTPSAIASLITKGLQTPTAGLYCMLQTTHGQVYCGSHDMRLSLVVCTLF